MEITCKREITVGDIPSDENIVYIDNSQDIEEVKKYLGSPDWFDYGCLFVEVLDGEYGKIYACESNVPYLYYWVDTIELIHN